MPTYYTRQMKFNSMLVSIIRVMTHILTLSFMIPAARILGPTTLGKVAVVVTLIPIFTDLIDFGGSTFVARNVSSARFSQFEVQQYLNRKFAISFALFIPWSSIFFLMGVESKKAFALSCCLVLFNILNLFNKSMEQIAIATGNSKVAAAGLFIERMGWSSFAVFVFTGFKPLVAFSIATFIGYFLQAIFQCVFIYCRLSRSSVKPENLEEFRVKSYYDIGIKTIISNLYLSNQIIVTILAGPAAGGIFSVAYRLRNLLVVGYSSVSWSITQDLLRNNSRENFKQSLFKNRLTLSLNTVGLFSLFFFSEEIVLSIFGLRYEQSIIVLQLLCISQLLSVFQVFITTYLMCSYFERSLRKMVTLVVPFTLVCEGSGAMLDGARGAAFGTLFSTALTAIVYIQKYKSLSRP